MTKSITRPFLAAAALSFALGTAACSDDPAAPAVQRDIIQTAQAAGSFTTLLTALDAANLTTTLQGAGPFTVFAPTDSAFAALPAGTVSGLLADIPALTSVLTYHVVSGAVPASQVVTLDSAATLNGKKVAISVTNGVVYVNGARVVQKDIQTSNGIIHVIDGVLVP